jgi:nucleoside phosphorylase
VSRSRGGSQSLLRAIALGALAVLLPSCGCDDDAAPPPAGPPRLIAVLSAFPAELAPLVEQATVEETVTIDDRLFHRGMLAGVPVVLALTGIGLVNAENTTRALLEHFDVTGIVFSGVAGGPLRIGDVTVPVEWRDTDGMTFPATAAWLEIAEEVSAPDLVELERCTLLPANPDRGEICMEHQPVIAVGGFGSSSDPFNGMAFPCVDGGNDVFGCDVVVAAPAAAGFAAKQVAGGQEEPIAVDMETAPVARVAAANELPFIAFRAVSDGAGDPLNLPGFPAQFFAYYRLAGQNAALATIAFLERLGATP